MAARAVRQILVDHARRRQAQKRGAGLRPDLLEDERMGADTHLEEILAVADALGRLEALAPCLARSGVELTSAHQTASTL